MGCSWDPERRGTREYAPHWRQDRSAHAGDGTHVHLGLPRPQGSNANHHIVDEAVQGRLIIGFDEPGGGIGGHKGPPLGSDHGLGPREDRRGIRVDHQGLQVGVVLRHERGKGFPVVVEAIGCRGAQGHHSHESRRVDRIGADVMNGRHALGQGELPPHLQQNCEA